MKVKLGRGVLAFAAMLLLGAAVFMPSQAFAHGEEYVFNYNPDAVESIKKALEDNDHSSDTAANQTTVYGRKGIFGNTPVQFKLDNNADSKKAFNNTYVYKSSMFRCGDYQIEAAIQMALPDNITQDNGLANIGYKRVLNTKTNVSFTPGPGEFYVSRAEVQTMAGACRPSNYAETNGVIPKNFQKNKSSLVRAGWPDTLATASSAAGAPASGDGGGDAEEQTCQSEGGGLAWMLCPTIELIHDTVGALMKDFILSQLEYDPLSVTPGGGATASNNIYAIWSAIRNLANVLFVLIFLFIVFANTVGMNVNAYTVKKMLPRLVAAVILVQLSFLISALIIDAGNIAGQGIGALISQALPDSATRGEGGGIGIGWGILTGAVLGLMAVGIISQIGIATVILLAIAAIFSVLSVVVTLVLRDLIISVLVITSPLAFAAWVLPGTQKAFQTWWRLFLRIIIMYPMIALLFSMSSVLASASTGATGSEGLVQSIVAGIFPIIAFMMVPWTFKWAGGAMSMTAGYVDGLSNKSKGGAQSFVRSRPSVKAYEQARADKKELKLGNALGSKGIHNAPRRWYAQAAVAGAPFAGRVSRKGGWGKVSPDAQQRLDQAQKKQWAVAQKSMEGLSTGELEKKLTGNNTTHATAAAAQLAENGQLSSSHIKDLKAAHGGNAAQGAKSLAYAQSKMKDKASNPVLARAKWGDIDNSTGEAQKLDQRSSQSLIQATSPKSLGSLSKEGLQALERADGEVIDPTTGAVKTGKMIDHIDTKTIETALKSGSISGSMRPEIRARLQAIVDNRTGTSTTPLPDTHSW